MIQKIAGNYQTVKFFANDNKMSFKNSSEVALDDWPDELLAGEVKNNDSQVSQLVYRRLVAETNCCTW